MWKFNFDNTGRSKLPTIKSIEPFAIGLNHPGHMEFTQDGRLLVSEFGRGRITDITGGGDFRNSTPFVDNLVHPAGIVTNYQGDQILVADTGLQKIINVTKGGDASTCPIVYQGLEGAYGITVFGDDLYAVYSNKLENGLVKIPSSVNVFSDQHIHSGGYPNTTHNLPYFNSVLGGECGSWAAVVLENKLLYTVAGSGSIYDVTQHSTFSVQSSPFITGLDDPLGSWYVPEFEHIFIAERATGNIKAIPKSGGYAKYYPALVTGLRRPSCLRFSPDLSAMFVCDFSNNAVMKLSFV
ncbi:TPA: hypothetical protein ACPVYT_004701 [Vibrio parahaemolyticus]